MAELRYIRVMNRAALADVAHRMGRAGAGMYEFSIAEEINRPSRSAVADRGAGRLTAVWGASGEQAAVEPDLLHLAWHTVTESRREVRRWLLEARLAGTRARS